MAAAFFCYSGVEQTTTLWAASYLVLHHGLTAQDAAGLAALFYMGITGGRALCGFLTLKFRDVQMIHMGFCVVAAGVLILLLPLGQAAAMVGLVLVGLGCAPLFPSFIHLTPTHFGSANSQAVIGVQMAAAYGGTTILPPLFGVLSNHISIQLFPLWLLLNLGVIILVFEGLLHRLKKE